MKLTLRDGNVLDLDAPRLARELDAAIAGEVHFDAGGRALYATDASNYRQVPVGVVVPRTKDDVIATVGICRDHGVPITSRGAGTSLSGQCCNVAVIIDVSKHLNRIIDLDIENRRARVEPGVVLDQLRDAAEPHHLTFGCDTSTHAYATLGGCMGNNACGVHSILSGRTSDNVHELEIITYDGLHTRVGETSDAHYEKIQQSGGRKAEIYRALRSLRDRQGDEIRRRFPRIPRRVSGYNLDDLLPENNFHVARSLIGSEGTCATFLESTVRLVDWPPHRVVAVLGYPDIYTAGDHVPDVMARRPIGLEAVDHVLIDNIREKDLESEHLEILPEGRAFLLVEFGGNEPGEAADHARRAVHGVGAVGHAVFEDRASQEVIWSIRESGLPATARVPGADDTWEGWEDSAVAPERLGAYLRDLRDLYEQYDYKCALYGHFGQGCVHSRIDFGLKDANGIRKFRSFLEDASTLVVRHGGSFSGEHGDGQSKAAFLPKLFGPEIVRAFREFKSIWDPDNRMNPGKVVDPYEPTENLRLGADYQPRDPATVFQFSEDRGSFAYAMERCVGVGKCRRPDSGTMCPSYMVTREEQHSTRGRARLLFEMLQGDVIGQNGWREDSVREALDLCLACKACKSECPMNVDMATYKAEFLHHYYKRRLRPRAAYAMGLIFRWARLAAIAPQLANAVAQAPGLGRVLKALGGIAPQRRLPQFARRTFRQWWRQRPPGVPTGRNPVMLWPDTFTNHFHPEIGIAAVEVLERLGFAVDLPREPLCCGRPLYDFGMLRLARRQLIRIIESLRPAIKAGVPLVGLEPSCVSVFRDELPQLLPHIPEALTLSKLTMTLGALIAQRAAEQTLPNLPRRALVHIHCHQRGVLGLKSEQAVLDRLGLEYEIPDSGCCGMAGAFGFEQKHYDVSQRCAERVLLPRIRQADADTLLVVDGFSCREQIEQNLDRAPLHLAQVLRLAWSENGG